jgi:hypothetical protein
MSKANGISWKLMTENRRAFSQAIMPSYAILCFLSRCLVSFGTVLFSRPAGAAIAPSANIRFTTGHQRKEKKIKCVTAGWRVAVPHRRSRQSKTRDKKETEH